MVRPGFVLACLALALAPVAPAGAQSWAGGEGIEVRVEDAKGRSVAGAEVVLIPEGAPAGIAFAPVPTDDRGRAAIGGLAPGTWELEVRHPGAMTYAATVVLGAGKPQVTGAAHRNVPGATGTLRVRLARAAGAPSPRLVVAEPRIVPPPRPPAEVPAPPPPAAPTPPTVPTAQPVTPEPVPPRAAPPPAPPAAAPMTPLAAPVVASPAPAPIPEIAARPVPQEAVGSLPPTSAPPLPAPQRAAPRAATLQGVATPDAPARRASVAARAVSRSCFECRPGESARALDVAAFAGGERCPADAREKLAATPPSAWAQLAASLPSGCALLAVELAPGERYSGFRYEATAPGGRPDDCRLGQECAARDCRFLGEPVVRPEGGRTLVAAIFESGAERAASFVVYTRPAR